MACALYNVPYSAPFLDVLAQKFLRAYQDNPLGLSNVLFLMQNRRSCQTLKNAFLQSNNLKPFLLPQIVPVSEADDDDIFFESEGTGCDLPAAVSFEKRLFLLAKMIRAQKQNGIDGISYAQSLALAADLGKLLDEAYNENLSFDNLQKIVPAQYAEHWQRTLDFLKIVTAYWPDILKEKNLTDACQRRNILLERKAEQWLRKGHERKIVAAGLDAPYAVLKKMMKAVYQADQNEIYFYGLNKDMSDEEWGCLNQTHPQYPKKELLLSIGAERSDVEDMIAPMNMCREKLVSEAMREAETTDLWRLIKDNESFKTGLDGIHFVETADVFEEALAVALIMRDVLRTPKKTAALVTPDRNFARAVASALKKFGVDIDDSAGLPLHLSPIGIYLRQILDVLENDFSETSVAALLKNPFVRLGKSAQSVRSEVRDAEYEKRFAHYDGQQVRDKQDVLDALLHKAYENLKMLYEKPHVPLADMIKEHIALAEKLAEDDCLSGARNLWRHDDGRLCATTLAKILEQADSAEDVAPKEYGSVLLELLSAATVRKTYGTHPRLKILGLMEARFCSFDVMIAGSMTDDMWPRIAAADPFMSRTMKTDFGLPSPDKMIAMTSDEICALFNAKEVYLTRALRQDGSPTNKSRYWLRLETVLQALNVDLKNVKDEFYAGLACMIDQTSEICAAEPAMPRPPVAARPRRFSASALKKWMQNPYDIYAEKILKLKPLNALDEESDARAFGNLMHRALEKFCTRYPCTLDENASDVLRGLVQEELAAEKTQKIFWKAAAEDMITWFLNNEPFYRSDVENITTEARGQMLFEGPAGKVTIEARADRIDDTKDGCYKIADYKTGSCPNNAQVMKGFEPQLPVEGLIASQGGFEKNGGKLPAKPIKNLVYMALGDKIIYCGKDKQKDIDDVLEMTKDHIQNMINVFDDEKTPYFYNPNPQNKNNYSEYEHLSRYKEWKGRGNKNG